jgi:hypothetical protein
MFELADRTKPDEIGFQQYVEVHQNLFDRALIHNRPNFSPSRCYGTLVSHLVEGGDARQKPTGSDNQQRDARDLPSAQPFSSSRSISLVL